jgi:hypothetical protein
VAPRSRRFPAARSEKFFEIHQFVEDRGASRRDFRRSLLRHLQG